MYQRRYPTEAAQSLLALVESIASEIAERTTALEELEAETGGDEAARTARTAARATHKRELRVAERELEHLGCSLIDDDPVTIEIPLEDGTTITWSRDGVHELV